MKKTDLAYVAGIIDGEGSINITKSPPRKKNREINPSLYIQVGVTNTNEWLIRWLKFSFGGNINLEKVGRRPLARRDCWRWNLTNRKAVDFLTLITPYLRMKKPQAELALLFQSRKHVGNPQFHRSDEVRAVEEAQRLLMSEYNKGRV